jgi:hypothetical protein
MDEREMEGERKKENERSGGENQKARRANKTHLELI